MKRNFVLTAILLSQLVALGQAATIISPTEDVMASAFFFAPNHVRGYDADNRNEHRVSTEDAFGLSGSETIYIAFDANDFAGLTAPVASAVLSVESVTGNFNADAGPGNPFTVSAHGVTADPIASITDDTNPTGPIAWNDFYSNNILPASPAAQTVVDAFGTVEFDVTSLINDWLSGTNTFFSIALTGANETSGNDFLHGFLNNTENPGSTFLTVTAVPEPSAIVFALASGAILLCLPARRAVK